MEGQDIELCIENRNNCHLLHIKSYDDNCIRRQIAAIP
jgi:hypothetical protein